MSDALTTLNGSDSPLAAEPSPMLHTLAAAFQHARIGMAVWTPAGQLIDANLAFSRMFGYEHEVFLARGSEKITHPEDPELDPVQWPRLVAGETDTYQREKRYLHKDGSTLWGLVTVSAVRDDRDQFVGCLVQVQDITVQKESEDVLRGNEARLEALVGQLPVALYSLAPGAGGGYHYVSPLFEHLTGLGLDDLPASFEDLLARVHPDDREAMHRADAHADGTGEPTQVEYRIRDRNGEWIWVDNRSVLLRDEQGSPLAWHGVLLDINERKRLEAAARDSEERFRRAFEDAGIGMSIGGPDYVFLDVNPAYCRIVGRPREALIGRPFAEITHPDDIAAYARQHARLSAGEVDAYQSEKRYLRPDGTVVTGLLTVSAVRDDAGSLLYDIGQLQDITAQHVAEASLRESEERHRKLVEHLPAALYRQAAPEDGSSTFVSPSFATLMGIDTDDLPLGFPAFFERMHPDDREAALEAAANAEQTGEPMDLEYRLRHGDGSWIWVHDRSVLERDERGEPRTWTGILLDISDRKRLEAALRESEEHLRTIVEQLPAALYRLEPGESGRFTYTSPRYAALTGLTLDHHDGDLTEFFARVHPDDIETVRQEDAKSGRTGQPFNLEFRVRSLDGAWIWVHDSSTLTRDERGDPLAWHGLLLDVSERRELESSLKESEARFRSIFEGAGIGMALSVPEGNLLVANPALEKLLRYESGELEGVRVEDITFPDDLAMQASDLRRLRAGLLEAYQLEKRFVRKDGSIVWGLLNATSVKDDRGAVQAIIGQVQDISARKEAEAALRESEARFRALVQNDPDVTAVVDQTLTVVYISPSSLAGFGVPPQELLGPIEPNLHLIHPAERERVLALFGEVGGQPGATASVEARMMHRDLGWRWFQVTVANLLEDPGVDGYLFNLRDITDRKHAALASEAALEAQEAAIAELERLNQSKSRFLSTISHEFRTPLTAIIGYSELLAGNDSDPAVAEDAAVIHREASRLNRMVDDVLLIDRMDAGHVPLRAEPVDLNAIVQDVAKTLRPLTENHRLSLDLDPDLSRINGDRDRLAQAVTNLVSNAVRYSPAGGAVTIVTRNGGDEVILSVHDGGIGIAAEDMPRIFERFERVETGIAVRISGTGLGLSIVRDIAGLHEGRLWAESDLGLGSTFHLAIPARKG